MTAQRPVDRPQTDPRPARKGQTAGLLASLRVQVRNAELAAGLTPTPPLTRADGRKGQVRGELAHLRSRLQGLTGRPADRPSVATRTATADPRVASPAPARPTGRPAVGRTDPWHEERRALVADRESLRARVSTLEVRLATSVPMSEHVALRETVQRLTRELQASRAHPSRDDARLAALEARLAVQSRQLADRRLHDWAPHLDSDGTYLCANCGVRSRDPFSVVLDCEPHLTLSGHRRRSLGPSLEGGPRSRLDAPKTAGQVRWAERRATRAGAPDRRVG